MSINIVNHTVDKNLIGLASSPVYLFLISSITSEDYILNEIGHLLMQPSFLLMPNHRKGFISIIQLCVFSITLKKRINIFLPFIRSINSSSMIGFFLFFYPCVDFFFVKNIEVSGPHVHPILPFTKLSRLTQEPYSEPFAYTHGCTSPSLSLSTSALERLSIDWLTVWLWWIGFLVWFNYLHFHLAHNHHINHGYKRGTNA